MNLVISNRSFDLTSKFIKNISSYEKNSKTSSDVNIVAELNSTDAEANNGTPLEVTGFEKL